MPGPLKNQMMEDFAKALASRVKASDAYAVGHPNASRKTCQEAGSRLAKSVKVVARVAELESASVKLAEEAQKQAAKIVAKKITGVLLTMTDRRRVMGEIVMTSTDPEIRMKAAMNDAKLAGDLIDKTDLTTDGEALPAVLPSISFQMPASYLERRSGHN